LFCNHEIGYVRNFDLDCVWACFPALSAAKGRAGMQDVWEAQKRTVEHAAGDGCVTPEQIAFEEQMRRLAAADVVLVPYPVLSQEVS
jgi:hypothetical protein